jgi:hypothetical protein
MDHLVDLTRHAGNDAQADLLPVGQEIGAQGSANEDQHSSPAQGFQPVERRQLSQVHFLLELDWGRTAPRKDANPGAPVEHGGHAGAQHGNGQQGVVVVHEVSGSKVLCGRKRVV